MRKFITQISQWLLPPTCILCGSPSDIQKDLCYACMKDLPWLMQGCKTCASPLPSAAENLNCGYCEQQTRFFDRTLSPFQYQYPIDQWIIALKFYHQLRYAKLLGQLYTDYIKTIYEEQNFPELLIPIPLHTKRLRERGFNQALELARELKQTLKIPIDYKTCQRIRHTETQSLLPAKRRHNNVKNAFSYDPRLLKKHVAIIDDVMTTGETIHSFSKTLREQGIEKIDVWCIARAERRHKS